MYKIFGRRGKDEGDKQRLKFPAETGMQISSQAAMLPVTWATLTENTKSSSSDYQENKLNCIWRCVVRVTRQDRNG